MNREAKDLLDRQCKLRSFPIPAGYTVKTKGDANRGDLYWSWPQEGWLRVFDSNSFLYQPVALLQCVITPIVTGG